MQYSFSKGLKKSLISMVLIGLPMLLQLLPEQWLNLTLGGALVLIVNYLKIRYVNL